METMYFTFGVLTMIAMMLVGAVVYCILKVFKQEKQIKHVEQDITWLRNDMSDRFRDSHQQIDNAYTNARDIANAYTDMRIDKLEAKLTGANEAQVQLNNKNLLKG